MKEIGLSSVSNPPCRNIVCSEWYSNDNKAYNGT